MNFTRLLTAFGLVATLALTLFPGCGGDGPTGGGGNVDSLRISLVSPADGAVVHGPTPLQVSVTGSSGQTKVMFFVDAGQVSIDSAAPWEYLWDPTPLANGSSHVFRAVVTDLTGNADTTPIRYYIANYPTLNMSVTSPADGSAIQLGQTFSATTTGGAGGTIVTFRVDNVAVAADSAAPFEYAWDPSGFASGSAHSVQLIAADSANQSVTSTTRTVYARWLPMNATISTPADSSVIGMAVDIKAGINGGAGGNTVSFVFDGSPAPDDNTPPYQYHWNPTSLPFGSIHTVFAIVSDTSGQVDTTKTFTYFANWRLLASSGQSPHPINVRKVYARSTVTAVQFRVEFDNNWARFDSVGGIDCAFFLDVDQSEASGRAFVLDGNSQQVPINDIGAEYRIIVGGHGDSVWAYSGGNWALGKTLSSLTVARNSNFFECSVLVGDLGSTGIFDLVVSNVRFESASSWTYDWVPTSGHVTYEVDGRYVGPTGGDSP